MRISLNMKNLRTLSPEGDHHEGKAVREGHWRVLS